MYAELGGRDVLRDGDFGEDLVAALPHRGQSAERRTVLVTACGESLVGVADVHRHGARRRPCRQVCRGLTAARADDGFGVQHPRRFAVVGSGEYRHRARTGLLGGTDEHADGNAGRRHDERRLQGQFLDDRAPGLVTGTDHQFHESRTGEEDYAADGMIGQPWLSRHRESAGEDDLTRLGHLDDRAEQGVGSAVQAEARGVRGPRPAAGQPEAPAVERVRRDVDQPATVAHGAPVHGDAGGERLCGRGQEAIETAFVAPQCGHHDRLATVGGVGDGVLDARDEGGVRAGLDEGAVAVAARGAHGLVELDGLPDVAVPVAGVEGGAVDEITCDGGEECRAGRLGVDACQRVLEPAVDGLDLSGVRRVVDVDAAGADLQRLALPDERIERRGLAGHHDGRSAVDHRDVGLVGLNVDACQQLPGTVDTARQRHHARGTGQLDQQLAAQRHHHRGVAKRQNACDVGGGDLTLGVSDDGVRRDANRTPQLSQRHHDGEQGRLHDVDAVQAGCTGLAAKHVEQ
ncbi:hypothetical protein TUM20984_01390 [Mycobacterium antarcticum]|nr:hypothetical protein TUM20984_01390 [Mycolicibacterium sp. TUM20984]